jgi:O-antigen/teichoic acid export membrane protein
MSDDKAIGIYSVSVKIYNLVKVVAASVVAVAIPRIASLIEKKDVGELKRSVNRIFNLLLMVTVPIVVGLIVLREEAILIISSKEYITSAVPLAILSVDIFFNLVAYFWGQAILVPFKRDKELLKITVFSAILNIILNIILIPYFNEVATALTTLVAEFVWMVLCRREGMKLVGKMKSTKQFLKVVAGSLPIVAFSVTLKMFMTNMYLYIAVLVLLSGVAYLLIELLLKNEVFDEIFNQFKKKINN